ncbi:MULTISPECIES: hypothetical protein [unclassified Methylobacterium]|uniref:hypothetical protein n=1 Tax=unclassified Methylobacterium TaxID=2615210 RepID=UPI00226AEF3B|nr:MULTISPECIES: hypothetical protein [unclassified Methylobacterium]
MTFIRLGVTSLAFAVSLGAAHASNPEQTGSIDMPPAVAAEPSGPIGRNGTAVTLPEQSVIADGRAIKSLPPLKPLPKWDPHVCIGC